MWLEVQLTSLTLDLPISDLITDPRQKYSGPKSFQSAAGLIYITYLGLPGMSEISGGLNACLA